MSQTKPGERCVCGHRWKEHFGACSHKEKGDSVQIERLILWDLVPCECVGFVSREPGEK